MRFEDIDLEHVGKTVEVTRDINSSVNTHVAMVIKHEDKKLIITRYVHNGKPLHPYRADDIQWVKKTSKAIKEFMRVVE